MKIEAPVALKALRAMFQKRGFDIRFVGGCVRDTLLGIAPKDFDLCTDADPTEQIAIYSDNCVRYALTGLQHGTITVVLDGEPFEITSLRTETDHDGRWAKVAYTRDWNKDLSRRDLTFNAMAMTFDGDLIDPFGGAEDLSSGNVRFVGSADERIREDYLRILRWFRFLGRFTKGGIPDEDAFTAIQRNVDGLTKISRERVWSEMSRILTGRFLSKVLVLMDNAGLMPTIDLPGYTIDASLRLRVVKSKNPVTLLAAYLNDPFLMENVAVTWKMSRAEHDLGMFVARNMGTCHTEESIKFAIAVEGQPKEWLVEHLYAVGDWMLASEIAAWEPPTFPVKGADLIERGIKPGPGMGRILTDMRQQWGLNGYPTDKTTVMQFRSAM